MLSTFVKESIYSNILHILSLAQEGNPTFDYRISPYETLIAFTDSFDDATEEEIQYVEEVLEMELMSGSYVRFFNEEYDSFKQAMLCFFNDDEENIKVNFEEFQFGKLISRKIDEAVQYWEESYDG